MSASDYHASDERTLPTVVYALYLFGLISGITMLIGVVIAYANRGRPGSIADSHYTFQIRTFWTGLALWFVAGLCGMWGWIWGSIPFIGFFGWPFVMLSMSIGFLTHLWVAVRCIIGLTYVSRGDAYPRPRAWLA